MHTCSLIEKRQSVHEATTAAINALNPNSIRAAGNRLLQTRAYVTIEELRTPLLLFSVDKNYRPDISIVCVCLRAVAPVDKPTF